MRFTSLERKSPFLLIFILFILLIIISNQIDIDAETTLLEKVIHRITSPFVHGFSSLINGVSFVYDRYLNLIGTQKENEELRRKVAELRFKVMGLEEKNKRYQEIEKILRHNYPTSEELLFARVIFRNLHLSNQFAIINHGSNDGVMADMNVIAPDGLIGRIDRVGRRDSRVIFITDPSSQIAVRVISNQGQECDAILSGNSGECLLNYIPKDFSLKEGYLVETSGKDLLYFEGLPVGEVKELGSIIEEQERGNMEVEGQELRKEGNKVKKFIVKPSASFNLLNEVIIIKNLVEKSETLSR